MKSISSKSEQFMCIEADRVVELAREAFSACKEAASIVKNAKCFGDDSSGLMSASFYLYSSFIAISMFQNLLQSCI